MILFGIYRKEYLSQAIPVYMQYLEQRDKWEHVNTGTYAYYSPPLNRYFFIKNNTLVKIMRYGNHWKTQYVKNLKNSYLFKIIDYDNEVRCFFDKKEYLIEKKLDAVKRLILFDKMFNGFASLRECFSSTPLDSIHYLIRMLTEEDYDKYRYKIAYNNHYAYPLTVFKERINHKDNIVLGVKSPYYGWHIEDLIMLPKGTEYTEKVLKRVLDHFLKQERLKINHTTPKIEVIDIVGGNLIKSGIFKPYEMPMMVDKNELK